MNDYNSDNNYLIRKKVLMILVSAFVVLVATNIILFAVFSVKITKYVDSQLEGINESIQGEIPSALVEEINSTLDTRISSMVDKKFVSIFLENYKREYNLPENYAGIGVIVAEQIDSILELEVNAFLNPPYENRTVSSQASAFILNEEGYVLTNAHCVTFEDGIWEYVGGFFNTYRQVDIEIREFTTIKASFKGSNQQYDMEVVAYDIDKDLAIIKFKNPPSNLSPIVFGDSGLLNLGEEVAAIGNAQGLGTSLTTGVISNTTQPYNNVNVLQTDTVINPGNSGGPLFNIYGKVVGVVSFKIIHSEANEGLGFAIASSSVMEFIDAIQVEKGITINYEMEQID